MSSITLTVAAIGMERDLGFSDRVFGLGVGIFFASYLALQVPGALLVERWSARRVISGCMIAWGILTVLTGLGQTPLRCLLCCDAGEWLALGHRPQQSEPQVRNVFHSPSLSLRLKRSFNRERKEEPADVINGPWGSS